MTYGKHGRFDDTCQDKRLRMKKRHPCRFNVEPLVINVETCVQGTFKPQCGDLSEIRIRQRPEPCVNRRLAIRKR